MAKPAHETGLDSQLLHAIAQAALENADELCDEAALLFAEGRSARAYVLANYALEEFGKFMSCVGAVQVTSPTPEYVERFWQNFRDHRAKYGVGLGVLLGRLQAPEAAALLDNFNDTRAFDYRMRLGGLYVGVDQHGAVTSPRSLLDDHRARMAVDLTSQVVRPFVEHYRENDLGKIFRLELEPTVKGLCSALAVADGEEVGRLLRSV